MSPQPSSSVNGEQIDHPAHYTSHPSGIEAIELCEHLPFNIGNALKYVFRAPYKGNAEADLAKAEWYLQRERALLDKIRRLEAKLGGRFSFSKLQHILLLDRADPLIIVEDDPLSAFARSLILDPDIDAAITLLSQLRKPPLISCDSPSFGI